MVLGSIRSAGRGLLVVALCFLPACTDIVRLGGVVYEWRNPPAGARSTILFDEPLPAGLDLAPADATLVAAFHLTGRGDEPTAAERRGWQRRFTHPDGRFDFQVTMHYEGGRFRCLLRATREGFLDAARVFDYRAPSEDFIVRDHRAVILLVRAAR